MLVDVGDITIDDLNDFLEEHSIGYYCEKDALAQDNYWIPRDKSIIINEMSETQEVIKSAS